MSHTNLRPRTIIPPRVSSTPNTGTQTGEQTQTDTPLPDAVYIGIDPGIEGGIAWIRRRGGKLVFSARRMPKTYRELWLWICRILGQQGELVVCKPTLPYYAVIEQVTGYVGERAGTVNPATGSSMFVFGSSYGSLCMALTAASISYEEVHPKRWQAAIGLPGMSGQPIKEVGYYQKREAIKKRHEHKQKLRQRAEQLFPGDMRMVNTFTADALLLAEYCRRVHEGCLQSDLKSR